MLGSVAFAFSHIRHVYDVKSSSFMSRLKLGCPVLLVPVAEQVRACFVCFLLT